ncbi:MAG TPA: DUF1232 domain-containing protein [Candidatus Bathyarchaeia archaeon]|nr:DUF1232 domain-containing protein [Candidatus Bathyarchaeia archaeon]
MWIERLYFVDYFTPSRSGTTRKKRVLRRAKESTGQFTHELNTLYAALKHPAVPWHAKACAAGAVAYAMSPVTLIPDFIPVLGQLDNMLALIIGMALLRRMIPTELLEICRQQARDLVRTHSAHKVLLPTLFVFSWGLSLVGGVVLLQQWCLFDVL